MYRGKYTTRKLLLFLSCVQIPLFLHEWRDYIINNYKRTIIIAEWLKLHKKGFMVTDISEYQFL